MALKMEWTVTKTHRLQSALLLLILALSPSLCAAGGQEKQDLDRRYQAAVAQYEAGHFSEAVTQLESLLPYAPESFSMHELLGLNYAALGQSGKALEHLQMAVRL